MSKEEFLTYLKTKENFMTYNGYEVIEKDEKIILKVNLTDKTNNIHDFAHGGLIFGLGDSVMGIYAAMQGKKPVTMSSNIIYIKPGVGKYIYAECEVLRIGKKACYLRANIYNDKAELISTMTGDYFFID